MGEACEWSAEEDRLLRWVYESSGLSKWSHIARRLCELGVRGRNGKQCKERYVTRIDTSHPREDWPRADELRLYELHNQLGNKWAVMGAQLDGRTDNAVKNHFYARLRRALKRLNRAVAALRRRDLREAKPNVLYRIVEVDDEKFKEIPRFDRDFSAQANHLKNRLLHYSYEEEEDEREGMSEEGGNGEKEKEGEEAVELLRALAEFTATYRKKTKKGGAGLTLEQDLLTPTRYQRARRCNSENEESEGSSSAVLSSDTSQFDDHSEDEVRRSPRRRKNSVDNSLPLPRIRTRAYSQGAREAPAELEQMKAEVVGVGVRAGEEGAVEEGELEAQLGELVIFEEEQLPPHPLLMKKETSKYSRFSENAIEKEQYHFFEDSEIEMRILPELDPAARRESQYGDRLFS